MCPNRTWKFYIYVALLHGVCTAIEVNFSFRRKLKITSIRNPASLSQLKEMEKKEKREEEKIEKHA